LNHRNTTLAVAAIIAAAALTGVAFAIPQQVMAGGYGHRHGHNHNNHNNSGIKVDQQVNQENQCGPQQQPSQEPPGMGPQSNTPNTLGSGGGSDNSGTTCVNIGANSADIHR
jgi:hypothetical protein